MALQEQEAAEAVLWESALTDSSESVGADAGLQAEFSSWQRTRSVMKGYC